MVTPPTPQSAKPEKKGPLQEQTIPTPSKGRKPSCTMTALSTNEFIIWANRLAGLPWSMTTGEFTRIALGEFDRKFGEGEEDFLVEFSSGAESVWVESNEDGHVDQVFIPLLVCIGGDVGKPRCVNDYFAEYATVGSAAWETMVRRRVGRDPLGAWKHSAGSILELDASAKVILFTFYAPQGVRCYE